MPSRAALNELPSAIRNAPLRSWPASPIARGLSRGGSAPSLSTGTMTARSLRGSAAMNLGVELLPVGRANEQLAAPAHDVKEREDLPVVADDHSRPEIERDQVGWIGDCAAIVLSEEEQPRPLHGWLSGRFRPRMACVSCEFSPLKRWIATTDGSALAIASAMTVSSAATTSAGDGAGGFDAGGGGSGQARQKTR